MTDDEEAKLRAATERGARAHTISTDPMFIEACMVMKDAALRDLIAVPLTGGFDGEADQLRVVAQIKVMLVEQFVNAFVGAMRDGKLAAWELNART